MPDAPTIEAAGAVLWRASAHPRSGNRVVEVALVHRPKYGDWSLPKGKLDAGEHPLLAALREVQEETGHRAVPGRPLGEVRYRVGTSPKRVRYWSARAVDGAFTAGREVDELRWLPPAQAARLLAADRDRGVLDTFLADTRVTTPLLVLRHASAGDRGAWQGEDRQRPLDARGQMQARALVALLAAYAVEALTSADVTRCRDTLAPYAQSAGLTVTVDPRVGTDCADPTQGVDALVELAGRASAVCSQREVIATLVAGVCTRLGRPTLPNDVGQVPRASVVVLHVAEGRRLVAREWLPAPGLAQRGGTPQPGG